jgi:hypothetical protein
MPVAPPRGASIATSVDQIPVFRLVIASAAKQSHFQTRSASSLTLLAVAYSYRLAYFRKNDASGLPAARRTEISPAFSAAVVPETACGLMPAYASSPSVSLCLRSLPLSLLCFPPPSEQLFQPFLAGALFLVVSALAPTGKRSCRSLTHCYVYAAAMEVRRIRVQAV